LILGANAWAREIANALQEENCPVRLIDTNRSNITQARMAELEAIYGNVLASDIVEELDLDDVGHLMALTSNDEVNSLATLHFVEMFGRSEVYQLAVESNSDGDGESLSHHLQGRQLFGREFTYRNLTRRFATGATIKKTSLTEEFTFKLLRTLRR
jgi:TrkA-N domain